MQATELLPTCHLRPTAAAEDTGLKKGVRGKYRTRRDKEFCSKACAQWWSDNYGNSKKAQLRGKKR